MSVKSKAQWATDHAGTSGTFADNITRDISESDMRGVMTDLKDSTLFVSDNFIDEDSFATNSATKAPSQQSVKAYIDSFIQTSVTVTVSSAEILNLSSTPKVLIASAPAGSCIVPLTAVIKRASGGTAYATYTSLRFVQTGSVGVITADATTFLASTDDRIYYCNFSNGQIDMDGNNPLTLIALAGNPTTGTYSISVTVNYITVTV